MSRVLAVSLGASLLLMACGGTGRQLKRANSYFEDGRYKAAARSYDDVLEKKPQEERALLGSARAWALAGESELAIARAQAARQLDVDGADEALGRALIDLGRGAEARQILSDGSPEAALLLAEAQLASRDYDAALGALAKAGDSPEALVLRGWVNWRAGGQDACDAASVDARDAAAAAYEDFLIQADAASLFRLCGATEQAEAAARTSRTFHLDGSARFKEAALRRQAGGDDEGAARQLARAVALYPDEGLISRDLGVAWLALDAYPLAVTELQRALPLDPYVQDLQQHQIVVSTRNFDVSVLEPMVQDVWMALHVALTGARDAPNAAAALERSLLLKPSSTATEWTELARSWAKVGAHRQAEAAARKALQLDGADPAVWLTLADVRWAAGAPLEAAGFARRAWELDVGAPAIAVRLAEADLAVGDADEAQRILETTIQKLRGAVHPLSPRLHSLLVEAQAALGR